MNAVLPTAPTSASGGAAAIRTAEPRAERGSVQVTSDFLGQLAQALGATDTDLPAAGVPELSAAPPQDGHVPHYTAPAAPAAPTAQQAAPVASATAPSGQPEPARAAAPAPNSSGRARRASAPRDSDAASEPLSEMAAPATVPPGQPEPAQAPARAPDTSGEARRGSKPREHGSASEASSKTAAPARMGGQQDPSPASVVTALPAPVIAGPVQEAAGQGSNTVGNATEDAPVQGAAPDFERLPARRDQTTTDVAMPQDAIPPASPHEALPLHQLAAAQPASNTPEIASLPGPISAPALPSSAQSGIQTPATHAASPPSAALPSPTHASPPGPAVQIMPALVHIAATADGSQRVTVRLDPVELGELHVRIERPQEGPVQVTVEATRPETLQLLRQDEPALHRALDQAGLPSEGRIVVLQSSADNGGQRQGAAEMGGNSAGGDGQGGSRGSSQGWRQHGSEQESAPGRQSRSPGNWLRAGVNITA